MHSALKVDAAWFGGHLNMRDEEESEIKNFWKLEEMMMIVNLMETPGGGR